MSEEWKKVFDGLVGQRVLIERDEGNNKLSCVVLKVSNVTPSIVEGVTDKGVTHWMLLSTVRRAKVVFDYRS